MDVVGCFVIVEDKLLLVKRADHKSHSGLWAIPSGKQEKNETKSNLLLLKLLFHLI